MKNLTQKIKRRVYDQNHWKIYNATDHAVWSQIFEIRTLVWNQISRHLFYQIRIHIERLKIMKILTFEIRDKPNNDLNRIIFFTQWARIYNLLNVPIWAQTCFHTKLKVMVEIEGL